MSKPYQKYTFKNGLRLVTVPMKNTKAVTVLVLVGTGSKYETKEINGISHFLEHMFFKGTKSKSTTAKLIEPLDRVGGEYNAFTDKEMTGYWAKVDAKHFQVALDWVSDILLNSKLEAKEIKREKGVIIEEINMYLDDPKRHIVDVWDELLYGDQPAGWNITGKKELIRNLKRTHFIQYLQSHYSASNTIIAIAGNQEKIKNKKEEIKKNFKNISTIKAPLRGNFSEKQIKPEVKLEYKKTDQSHLCLGVRTFNIFHKDRYILSVLANILGGGLSSRMWTSVRERKGLAYYVWTKTNLDSDAGFLAVRAGVNNEKTEEAIKTILDEYKKIRDIKVAKEELRKAKDYIKGTTILSMESSDEQASFYVFQELLENKILTPEQIFAKIEAVTAEDVQRVARDIFKLEKLNLALIGPFKEKAKFEKLLKL